MKFVRLLLLNSFSQEQYMFFSVYWFLIDVRANELIRLCFLVLKLYFISSRKVKNVGIDGRDCFPCEKDLHFL